MKMQTQTSQYDTAGSAFSTLDQLRYALEYPLSPADTIKHHQDQSISSDMASHRTGGACQPNRKCLLALSFVFQTSWSRQQKLLIGTCSERL